MSQATLKPVVLVIRDGWGENHNAAHDACNAVKLADTPVSDRLTREWPRTEIRACGLDVGLPDGVMGNSEVGHQNIGAGRIVDQEVVRIDKAFADGVVTDNAVLQKAIERERAGGTLHLFGIVSDAGVHGMLSHLYHLLKLAQARGCERVCIHAFTDGRDTPPRSGLRYIREVEEQCREIGVGRIASVCGRFWSMDRDKRWDRVQKAYDCLTGRDFGRTAASAGEAVEHYYKNPISETRNGDEFVVPTAILDGDGEPLPRVSDGDAVIFYNYRGDRPRELTRAFIDDDFEGFDRGEKRDLFYATMTEYESGLCENILFRKPPKMDDILGMVVSRLGIPQFRCAETEKYPHVTFFFNDYREEPFNGEERDMIPSPQDVPTYDLKPEMSAEGVKAATLEAVLSGKFGLIVVNFANADMVGHTGSLEAAKTACAVVDRCLGELLDAIDKAGGRALITADHGNSDQMFDETVDGPHTAHTLNPVEVVLYGEGMKGFTLRDEGRLADIAPTLLQMMGIEQPAAMTGQSLIR